MIVTALVSVKQIDKDTKVIELRSPKYSMGRPIFILPGSCDGLDVKFITDKDDIPVYPLEHMQLNGVKIGPDYLDKVTLTINMWIRSGDTIYVVTAEPFIK